MTDLRLINPALRDTPAPLSKARMGSEGALTAGSVYYSSFSQTFWVYLRNAETGSTAHVQLPYDTAAGWTSARTLLTSGEIWILSGSGPLYLRRYRLEGTPLPSTATRLNTWTFGDSDSRDGDLIRLSSGAIAVAWHQHGATGPQGHRIAYRSPAGATWQTVQWSFMPTRSAKEVLVQHPADGSVWLFSNADGWGAIGATRLTEGASGLSVAWSSGTYIDGRYGDLNADPEWPDLVAARDEARGEIVLVYESARRRVFSSSPFIVGSSVAVARIPSSGTLALSHVPVYVERISRLGLVVSSGTIWIAHRPVDEQDLSYDDLWLGRLSGTTWTSVKLGTLAGSTTAPASGGARVEFGAQMSDGAIHHFLAS